MNSGPRHASEELVRAYASRSDNEDPRGTLLAKGRSTRDLVRRIQALAPAPGSVLICGETGTGKTLVARELHRLSAAGATPLRMINCAALQDTLLADVLWELEDHGRARPNSEPTMVLLDEVGELSPWAQAVLLHKVQPAESAAEGPRFVAATHRDLSAMALAGTFSRELLARLSSHKLTLQPLRARKEEIAPLALHFLRCALAAAAKNFVSLDGQFLESLEAYDWPGNARELNNAMMRALAVNESGTLSQSDLPDAVRIRTSAIVC